MHIVRGRVVLMLLINVCNYYNTEFNAANKTNHTINANITPVNMTKMQMFKWQQNHLD